MALEGLLCQLVTTGRPSKSEAGACVELGWEISENIAHLQAAATAEYRRNEGDAETTASGEEDEPVSEEDALDIQELLKKAITSSAV